MFQAKNSSAVFCFFSCSLGARQRQEGTSTENSSLFVTTRLIIMLFYLAFTNIVSIKTLVFVCLEGFNGILKVFFVLVTYNTYTDKCFFVDSLIY